MKHLPSLSQISRKLTPALVLAASLFIVSACSSGSTSETDTAKATADASESTTDAQTNTQTNESSFDTEAYSGPTFELQLTSNNETVKFTDYLGKGTPVVLNFWGTWCPPCRREMPEFKKVYSEYKDLGVEIVGVALRDTPKKINAYTTQQGIEWPQVVGGVPEAKAFGNITGVPTTIVYDSHGTELNRFVGPLPYTMLKDFLDKALAHEKELAKS